MENTLSADFLHVVEQAAITAAYTIGNGNAKKSDHLAVESMRKTMENLPINGTIVIGEGERDLAPMLYIGEKVGKGSGYPKIDIAVDPLEGTNLCATGANNAITVLAASEQGGLLHAPDLYMHKLCVGPELKGKLHIDAEPADNIKVMSDILKRPLSEITIVVLNRPRHAQLINDIRSVGARVHLIEDGDLLPAVSTALAGTNIHAVMGIGGAPEGVLTAAALKCLGGEIQCRMVIDTNTASKEQAETMGVDLDKIYKTDDLVPGEHIIFAACGVTNGNLLDGVKITKDWIRTSSMVLNRHPRCIKLINTIHINENEKIIVSL